MLKQSKKGCRIFTAKIFMLEYLHNNNDKASLALILLYNAVNLQLQDCLDMSGLA